MKLQIEHTWCTCLMSTAGTPGEGPAAHHTILADPILRSGRPINTARIAEKTPKVPRTPKTPAQVPAPPTHYESGGQMWPIPACSLDSHHCSQLGHGRLSVKAAFSGATVFITGVRPSFWLRDRLAEQPPKDQAVAPLTYEVLPFQTVRMTLRQEASLGMTSMSWKLYVQDHGEAGGLVRTCCVLSAHKGIA